MGNCKYYNAHEVEKGDPKIYGPYLDDIRAAQVEARRDARKKNGEINEQTAEGYANKNIRKLVKNKKAYDVANEEQRPVE